MTSEKVMADMAALYSNFKVSPSKLAGELRLSEQYSLRVDTDKSPDEWMIFDAASGGFISQKEMKGASKLSLGQFVLDYKEVCEGQAEASPKKKDPKKDPLDNLKAGGFEFSKESEAPKKPERPKTNGSPTADSTPKETPAVKSRTLSDVPEMKESSSSNQEPQAAPEVKAKQPKKEPQSKNNTDEFVPEQVQIIKNIGQVKVQITKNSKGRNWEITAYADNMNDAVDQAIAADQRLQNQFGGDA